MTLIKNRTGGEEVVTTLFKIYDKNKNGTITTSQFFQLVVKHLEIWTNLFRTRENLLKRMLSINEILTILERKRNINNIKNYQSKHYNKLPPRSCGKYLNDLIHNKVNPASYDYNDVDGSITLTSIITSLIKKYNTNYKITENDSVYLFNIKYFKFKNGQFPIPALLPIDNYYSYYPEFQNKILKRLSPKDSVSYQNVNNTNNNNNRPVRLRSSVSVAVVGYDFMKQIENSQKYPAKSSLSQPHYLSTHPSRAPSFAELKPGERQSYKDYSNFNNNNNHPTNISFSPVVRSQVHVFKNGAHRPVARSCGFNTDFSPSIQKKFINLPNSPVTEVKSIDSKIRNKSDKIEHFSGVEETTESYKHERVSTEI